MNELSEVAKILAKLQMASGGGVAPLDKQKAIHEANNLAIQYKLGVHSEFSTELFDSVVLKEEEYAIFKLRDLFDLEQLKNVNITVYEIKLLRKLIEYFPLFEENDIHTDTLEDFVKEYETRNAITPAPSAQDTERAVVRPPLRRTVGQNMIPPREKDSRSGSTPAGTEEKATSETPKSLQQTEVSSSVPHDPSPGQQGEGSLDVKPRTRTVILTFDAEELREMEAWTILGEEALRAFIRTAVGNHIFIQTQYDRGCEFLLQENDPSGKQKPGGLRKLRFR